MSSGKVSITPKKIFILLAGIIGIVLLLVTVFGSFGINNEGYYVIKQSLSGNVTVINKPGPYWKLWARTQIYPISFEIFLSASDLDGGKDADTQAVPVVFNDGSKAFLSSVTKVTVPGDDELRKQIHRDFKSASTFKANVRQYIEAIQKRSGSIFKAEEAYASKRTQLENIIDSQLRQGKFATESITEPEPTGEIDEDGHPIVVQVKKTIVRTDDQGNPVIEDKGFFTQYKLYCNYFNLKDVDPDEVTKSLIEQKKLAEQQRIVAQTEAEKAKQDAITAEEKGKARVAQAKADEEVAKITAVTRAQKEKEVAELNAQRELEVATLNAKKAKQEADAILTQKRAEATAAKLLVQAGLTPQERAEWNYKTQVGVADAVFKNYKVPEIMITGGANGGANPLDAIALNQLMEIVDKMSQQ